MKKSSTLKTALVVVGGGIAAAPASALELGEIKVHSTIGQPLRASIAYALGPNEALADTCVTLQPARGSSGLPSIDRASMIVTDGVIAITGSSIVREPLMSLRLNVRCPYTPQLTRDYLMFIDPAGMTAEPVAAPVAAPVQAQPVASRPQVTAPPAVAQRPPVVRPRSTDPIELSTRYQVQPGESLSEIAQRIENRPIGLWDAVSVIFAANPDAFLDSDPNKLKAGSWLSIPSFGAEAPLTVAAFEPAAAIEEPAEPFTPVGEGTAYDPAATAAEPAAEPAMAETPIESPRTELQPGDVILDSDNPFIGQSEAVAEESVVIPDTRLDGPETVASNPNVPVQVIQPAAPAEPGTTNWLLWLGGGGVAIILAMFLFGRAFRDRFGSTPIAPAVPQRRKTDIQTEQLEAIGDVELDIPDDSPTEENLVLDADLIVGTGLQQGGDVDVAQDFGYAASTDLDLELPDAAAGEQRISETDIIPPIKVEESSILESEVLPSDDDYDMSVIVDATKVPSAEDVTERDLEAIQVDDDDETLITDDYTVSQEVDYKVLEQDYEDELTATQALNAEIQKAAEDLANRLDETIDDNKTAEMPLATVHELDVTAQLKKEEDDEAADDDDIGDDDDTGINPTVNMEVEGDTIEMTEESTVEIPKGDSKTG